MKLEKHLELKKRIEELYNQFKEKGSDQENIKKEIVKINRKYLLEFKKHLLEQGLTLEEAKTYIDYVGFMFVYIY